MIIPQFQWGTIESRVGDDVAVILSTPQQYLLMQLLSFIEQNPEQFLTDYADYDSDDIDAGISATMNALLDETLVSAWKFNRVRFTPDDRTALTGTLAWASNAAALWNGYFTLNNVQHNAIQWQRLALKKGTYVIKMMANTFASAGIVSFNIAGPTTLVTIDTYSVGTVLQALLTSSAFTIAADVDLSTIEAKMSTKHTSSTGYAWQFNYFEFIRTGD